MHVKFGYLFTLKYGQMSLQIEVTLVTWKNHHLT